MRAVDINEIIVVLFSRAQKMGEGQIGLSFDFGEADGMSGRSTCGFQIVVEIAFDSTHIGMGNTTGLVFDASQPGVHAGDVNLLMFAQSVDQKTRTRPFIGANFKNRFRFDLRYKF